MSGKIYFIPPTITASSLSIPFPFPYSTTRPISIPSLTRDLKKLNQYFQEQKSSSGSTISNSLKTLSLNTKDLSSRKKTKKMSYSSKSKNHSSTQKII